METEWILANFYIPYSNVNITISFRAFHVCDGDFGEPYNYYRLFDGSLQHSESYDRGAETCGIYFTLTSTPLTWYVL